MRIVIMTEENEQCGRWRKRKVMGEIEEDRCKKESKCWRLRNKKEDSVRVLCFEHDLSQLISV
jgi:hypothetical protein